MGNPNEQPVTAPVPAAEAPAGDVEDQTPQTAQTHGPAFGVSAIVRRWRREDFLKRGSLATRVSGLIFSILSFLIMVCNNHGDWRTFHHFNEYRYFVAISIMSMIYTGAQTFRQINELSTGKQVIDPKTFAIVDFYGDQILAYFLMSSFSAAVPLTNNLRELGDNLFTDSSVAAITMQFFAFAAVAISAGISGCKFFNQQYI
ncbi:CASP-like protein 4B4 [Impatiens glandulifera]|uniref:CASP-like protein 4B4 n=1 Tax=Impatiens glandulifera TaxID=253017 RepID=UPI001FB0515C|nr:CASP-like protein 4B4 [Impatiens glandulifera]